MLESTVLHRGRTGPRGQPNEVVGINWKAPTRSHPRPSLVVTCAHQVVVYKPGEERRTHQWSFKPSAATVLSHAAVFLPAASRYVGVQQGSTLVSWRESEQDVKSPLSSQATGPVQAVHACPQLGDYCVAVLASGGVAFYQGGLQRLAHCDAAGGGDAGGGSAANARAKAVWSGVRGDKVLVLENIGNAVDRVTTFSLSTGGRSGSSNLSASSSRRADAAGGGTTPASVTLVSSHVLTKPSQGMLGIGNGGGAAGDGEAASACSAAFVGHDGSGGGAEGRSVLAIAWRTSRGPMWSKVVMGAGGVTEEFARPVGTAATAVGNGASGYNGSGIVAGSSRNGHGTPKSKKAPAAGGNQSAIAGGAGGSGGAGWGSIPAIAAADGGRLLVHSGGGGGGGSNIPRLTAWDAAYGVLIEDGLAPEVSSDGGSASQSSGRDERGVGLKVSGDGAYLAIAAAGMVLTCPLPVKAVGTLASLLRRKRTSSSVIEGGGTAAAGHSSGGSAFPSVDLSRSAPASKLLDRTGALEAAKWEAAVVAPFREAEAEAFRSLREATRRKDSGAFERVLREHLQQRAASAGAGEACISDGTPGMEDGRKKRRRSVGDGGDYSAGVVAAAVELCLANPEAKLWGALAMLVRSGGVSARHHRGLVAAIVEHASPELLEEVMLHVPDLPEADAVRILRHFLSQAATLAEASKNSTTVAATATAAVAPEVPNEASGGAPSAKRYRVGNGGGDVSAGDSSDAVHGGGSIVASVLSPSKQHRAAVEKKGGGGGGGDAGDRAVKKGSHKTTSIDNHDGGNADADIRAAATKANGNTSTVTTNAPSLSNGQSASHDDGGTSSDSGAGSDGAAQVVATEASGKNGAGSRRPHKGASQKGFRAAPLAAATAAARAERGVRVALTLPHNEAFLRSSLAELSHAEVVVVLKILIRLLSEGKTLEAAAGAKPCGRNAAVAASGLPPARTDSAVGWACALLDSHFTRLAVGGAADPELVRVLKALKKATRVEAECCELLSQVRALVEEVGRRHAAAAAEARRRPSRELFSLRVVTF